MFTLSSIEMKHILNLLDTGKTIRSPKRWVGGFLLFMLSDIVIEEIREQ